MRDREFLIWVYKRLQSLNKVSEDIDYLCKFRSIIECIPYEQRTANETLSGTIDEIEQKEVY